MGRHGLKTGALSILSLSGLSGCMGGDVYDADTKSAVPNIVVAAQGSCSGGGCASSTEGVVSTGSSGVFEFNAYNSVRGTANPSVQAVYPASGQDAVKFTFIDFSGTYNVLSMFVHPNYTSYTYSDGSGPYLYDIVPSVYLCKPGDPDTDGDGLCDSAEAQYGTDPNLADTDGDGFSDASEILGLASAGVDLRYYGASATHKDVFLYVDYYTAPIQVALDQVVASFAAAPLSNPDGTTGISLHIIMGQQIAAADQVANFANVPADWAQFDTIKNKYFPPKFANVAHYVLFGFQYGSASSSGISRGIPAHDSIVTLGLWPTPGGTQLQQAGTLMHEFGHNLGLQHGGDEGRNYKPNYLSIMSYRYQTVGLYKDGTDGVLDYSRVQLATVDETRLVEQNGMAPDGRTSAADLAHFGVKLAAGYVNGTCNGPLDFNNNGAFDPGTESVDLDGNGAATDVFNPSWNDWDNLQYTGSATGGGTIGGGAGTAGGSSLPQIVVPSAMVRELDHP